MRDVATRPTPGFAQELLQPTVRRPSHDRPAPAADVNPVAAVEAPGPASVPSHQDPVGAEIVPVWAVGGRVLGPKHGLTLEHVYDSTRHSRRTPPANPLPPAAGSSRARNMRNQVVQLVR